jgi:hypothetical protein
LEILKKFGKQHLDKKTAVFLSNWMKEIEELCVSIKEDDSILAFLQVFKEIKTFP